jgi:hypothetical protein
MAEFAGQLASGRKAVGGSDSAGLSNRFWRLEHFMDDLFWFILSKDRPLQLDALLRSMDEMVGATVPCVVLYKASSDRYRVAYTDVFERHESMNLDVVAEQDFKSDVINIIRTRTCKRVAFLMDDQVFVSPVNLKNILSIDPSVATYSLRLGKRIARSQPLGNRAQGKPPFVRVEHFPDDWLAWFWTEGPGDWYGANSLDGNVLSRAMVSSVFELPMASRIFGPQSLEMCLNKSGIRTEVGVCSVVPQVVNLAVNRVSDEPYHYPHGTTEADELLVAWESGQQMRLNTIQTMEVDSCHVICDIPLERREEL